ncbi:MAG: FliH/SctL family protein [Armatimonadota bacterium]|jgi:flagellar assembly protein FliH
MAHADPRPWRWPSFDGDEPATRCGRGNAQASERAQRVLREGRRESERLVAQAREDAERIRENTREEAWAKALSEARGQLDAALRECVAEQAAAFESARASLLQQISAAAEARFEESERELLRLVATMAGNVIRRKVEAEDGVVLDVVRSTIEQTAGAKRLTVRVPAPDEPLVRAATAELLAATDGAEQLEIVADEAIGPGGCIVETERGRFDARIETQVELLGDEISAALGEGEGG